MKRETEQNTDTNVDVEHKQRRELEGQNIQEESNESGWGSKRKRSNERENSGHIFPLYLPFSPSFFLCFFSYMYALFLYYLKSICK